MTTSNEPGALGAEAADADAAPAADEATSAGTTDARRRGVTRRTVLRGAGVAALLVAGGLVWRADRQGVFTPRSGPAYDAWDQDPEGLDGLAAAAVLAASPHNIQNWLLHLTPGQVALHDDLSRGLGVVDALRREAHLGLGCALANLEIAGPPHGFDVATTLRGDGDGPVATLALTPRPQASPDALYRAIRARHSDRGAYPAEEPTRALLDEVAGAALEGLPGATGPGGAEGVSIRWVTEPGPRSDVGALLVDAAQALTRDEQMSIDNAAWMRYDEQTIERRKDGLVLDAQALSGVIELAAKMLPATSRGQGDATWVDATRDVHTATARAYGLVVADPSADATDVATRLRAGRALQRLHLALTARGWAMQHLNQAIEVAERESATGHDVGIGGRLRELTGSGSVLAMVRVGRPSGRAVASPRRPAAEVLV